MPIEVACSCGKRFRVRDEHAGRRGKCPGCGQAVVVPTPAPEPPSIETVEIAGSAAEVRQKACPECGAVISFYAIVCEQCGAQLNARPAKGAKSGPRAAAKSRPDAAPGSPVIGMLLGLGVGSVVAFGLAWAYAYVDRFFPIWSIIITIGFGALLGFVPSLMMIAGGLRSRTIGLPVCAAIVGFGYWLTWAVWVHATLNQAEDAPSVGLLMAHPSELAGWIGAINEAGAWRYSGNADPVHGGMLTIIWIGEALLILGAAMAAAWKTLADDLPSA